MPKDDEEYELMPHQTIAKIKHELDLLKKKAGSMQEISSEDFKKSIDKLTVKIDSLMRLFKSAAEEMKEEEEKPGVEEQIKPLMDRVNEIEDENKKIANGILVVADMIKELKGKKPKPKPRPKPVFRQAPPKKPSSKPKMPPPKPAPSGKEKGPSASRPMPPPRTSGAPLGPKPSGRPSMPPPPRPMGAPTPRKPQAPRPESQPSPMPPPSPRGPSPMPPLPGEEKEKGKKGFFSKLFKKKK